MAEIADNETIEHLWLQIETLWRNIKPAALTSNPEEAAAIDDLIAKRRRYSSNKEDWSRVNETEMRIGALLDAGQLYSQFDELLQLAKSRGLASLAKHEDNAAKYFQSPPAQNLGGQQLQINRDAYLYLLSDLQDFFVLGRLSRRLQREAAWRMFYWGVAVSVLVLAPFIVAFYWLSCSGELQRSVEFLARNPVFGLYVALAFGVAGAYFSRLTRFNTAPSGLSFDDFHSSYIRPMLLQRIITGLFGALILYFLLRSRLVEGQIFPDLTQLAFQRIELVPKPEDGKAVTGMFASLSIVAPNEQLAKLIVWSFIAGFSERLVPDSLTRIESGASATKK